METVINYPELLCITGLDDGLMQQFLLWSCGSNSQYHNIIWLDCNTQMETLPKIKSERRNLRSLQVSTDTKTEKYREGHWNNRFHMAHMKEFKDNIKLTLLDKLAV
jgi:hypothetical protein